MVKGRLILVALKMKTTNSYVEIALEICLLISSKAVDFIVTGCSSGQGMMIACNSLPHLIVVIYLLLKMLIYLEESMMEM